MAGRLGNRFRIYRHNTSTSGSAGAHSTGLLVPSLGDLNPASSYPIEDGADLGAEGKLTGPVIPMAASRVQRAATYVSTSSRRYRARRGDKLHERRTSRSAERLTASPGSLELLTWPVPTADRARKPDGPCKIHTHGEPPGGRWRVVVALSSISAGESERARAREEVILLPRSLRMPIIEGAVAARGPRILLAPLKAGTGLGWARFSAVASEARKLYGRRKEEVAVTGWVKSREAIVVAGVGPPRTCFQHRSPAGPRLGLKRAVHD